MMVKQRVAMVLLAAGLGLSSVQAAAQGEDIVAKGHQEFQTRCMQCHGENADGKGSLTSFLKITPADLTQLNAQNKGSVTERVLKAVIGRHTTGNEKARMPLLAEVLTPESIYEISEYIKTIQK